MSNANGFVERMPSVDKFLHETKLLFLLSVASPKLVMEEAPESYKDVTDVVNTCHAAGISRKRY